MSEAKTTKIKKLSVGSRFYKPGYPTDSPNEVWEIIGRARKAGGNTPDETIYAVLARHVSKKDQKKSDYPPKNFDVEFEVVEVAKPRKTVFAIDQRDAPEDIETIDDVANREGVKVNEGDE